MSLDNPNQYEQAVERYAAAVRRQERAEAALKAAEQEMQASRDDRQEAWRTVKAFVNEGKIEVGIYRVQSAINPRWTDGILIEKHKDYPDIFSMFR